MSVSRCLSQAGASRSGGVGNTDIKLALHDGRPLAVQKVFEYQKCKAPLPSASRGLAKFAKPHLESDHDSPRRMACKKRQFYALN